MARKKTISGMELRDRLLSKMRGETYNPFTPIHRAKTRPELSCVRLKHDYGDNDAVTIPKGTVGTIVHVWAAGMYEVEFNYGNIVNYHECPVKEFTSVVNILEKDIEDAP